MFSSEFGQHERGLKAPNLYQSPFHRAGYHPMEFAACLIGGILFLASACGLARLRQPMWQHAEDSSLANTKLQRWSRFQRGVRRSTNSLLALTGSLVMACAFVPHGPVWMSLWLLVFLALLSILMLAGLDAFLSMAGYRQAVPEAARRSFANCEPHPEA